MPKITFNGKTYNDLAEMPTAERQAYEQLMANFNDEDGDGTPDIFQGDVVSNIINAYASTNMVIDGKRVGGFRNLTQAQRLKLEKGLAMLQKLGVINEMPDLDGGGGIHAPHPTAMPVWDDAERPQPKPEESFEEPLPDWLSSERPPPSSGFRQNSVIQEEGVNLRVLLLVIGMLLLAGFGVLLFLLMQNGL